MNIAEESILLEVSTQTEHTHAVHTWFTYCMYLGRASKERL